MRTALALVAIAALGACAASPPRPDPPPRSEIVVDEAAVVRVSRASPGDGSERPLPPLPAPLSAASQPFQRGFALAEELLRAPGPSLPAQHDGADVDEAWLEAQFKPWLEQRMGAVLQMTETFAEIAPEGRPEVPSEEVPAIALLGLVNARAFDQLTAIPAPAHVRADPALLRVYQSELYTTLTGGLLGTAIVAFRGCASMASAQVDLAFGPWLDLCHAQLAAREAQQSQALALIEAVQREREAEQAAPAPAPGE